MQPEVFKKALEALSADLLASVEARRIALENDDGRYWLDLVERTFQPGRNPTASGPSTGNNPATNPEVVDGPDLQDETKEIFFWGKARNLVEVLQSSDMMTHMVMNQEPPAAGARVEFVQLTSHLG